MSKQWGHGFQKGTAEGISAGLDIGIDCTKMALGEHAWHTTNAALQALGKNDIDGCFYILRTLQFALAAATNRDTPLFNPMIENKA